MVESYKYKSKIATAISFLAALIVYLGKDGLAQIMPPEYANLIPIIVFAAGYVVSQKTEDKRTEIAEQLVHEEYAQQAEAEAEPEPEPEPENVVVNLTLDGEDVIKEDEVEEEPDINDGGC